MKTLSLMVAAAVVVFASGPAVAGGASFDWSGFYIGANAGYAFGNSDASSTTMDVGPNFYFDAGNVPAMNANGQGKLHPDGFTGGVQSGMNWQSGNIVFGGEVDFDGADLSASRSVTADYTLEPGESYTISQSVKANWLLTVRPRLGFASGNLLTFVTGGLAVADLKSTNDFSSFGEDAIVSASETKAGWTLGAGFEYACSTHWSMKVEYLYGDLGKITSNSTYTSLIVPADSNTFSHSEDLTVSSVRLGFNYRF